MGECNLKIAISDLVYQKEIPTDLKKLLVENVPKFNSIIISFQNHNCGSLQSFNETLVSFCQDSSQFDSFKRTIFEENLSSICEL